MTFGSEAARIMDDFSIQAVTPPLVDPLTEAANAHLAALAQAEAAEMIIKEPPNDNNADEKKPVKQPSLGSTSASSSSTTSLCDDQQQSSEGGKNGSDEDKPKLKVPIPLVEENKEPGVRFL